MERVKYSKLDLIGNELTKLKDKTFAEKALSFLLFSGKNVHLKIYIPNDLYLRAEVFCDDIRELSEDEFDQNILLGILYEDFLRVNRAKESLFNLYRRLTVHEKKSPSIKGLHIDDYYHDDPYEDTHELTVRIQRKEALRGEVLLSDLSNFYPDHPFTLEMVLETIYIDFLEDIKKDGSHKAVKELLKRMEG
ncbi:hypothetical protein [Alkalihalobacillus sp. BA299]|uniref:hypothetical protein n=1 Tax=Alkalihalobacillus sp. BA299 TaxID=2815938 RepID=UPI001ADAF0F7|nr:hypothetical protein [Alkalihalobacillus sp. BA299]